MDTRRSTHTAMVLLAIVTAGVARSASAAEAPTPTDALKLTPIQPLVEYTTPAADEIAQCTIRPEKENNVTSWVVRNRQGEVLRRFADSNNDNYVDQWCYFLGGVEVYRDIDSNFNNKADEYRWFNTAGTRWGVDKNEDGHIDSWKIISPHEVAEQIVLALKSRDPARFQLLLLTPEEITSLGLGQERAAGVTASVKAAPAAFSKTMAEQKIVTPQSRYVDFGSARPGTIPIGTNGSTKDVTICDNAAALVQAGDKHEQIFLGTLIAVGDTWKLIDAPAVGSDNQPQEGGLLTQNSQSNGGAGGDGGPSNEVTQQMAELEKLDKESDTLPPDQIAANVDKRVAAIQKLTEISPARDRDQWQRQLIDVLSVAIQSGNYPQGIEALNKLQKSLTDSGADPDLIAHAAFQLMWAQYALNQQAPGADAAKLQEKWLTDLQAFAGQYPKSPDTAEALYQLGMYQEIVGKSADATKLYQQLKDGFPTSRPAEKATGALRRLGSLGRPIALRGPDMQGGAVDLASQQFRGKVVLIQYWATLGERWKDDMVLLKDVYAKRGGRDFEIIGVCLDDDPAAARQYLAQNKFPWKQIYEKGGLDGRLANEMGVITLPLMILVDQKGNVANHNVHTAELESQLAKLISPAAPAAARGAGAGGANANANNALRPPLKPR